MRFIRQEEIITTICNKEITGKLPVFKVLENLKKEKIEFVLTVHARTSDYSYRTTSYDRARVQAVCEEKESVDFLVFQKSSMVIINNIPFSEIKEIFALTEKVGLAGTSSENEIWDFLDLDQSE